MRSGFAFILLLVTLAPQPASSFALPRFHPSTTSNHAPEKKISRLSTSLSRGWNHQVSRLSKGNKLFSAHASSSHHGATSQEARRPVDYGAIGKWITSLTVQTALIMGVFTGIDKLVSRFSLKIPFYANVVFFYIFNLKSSIFSLLPNRQNKEQQKLRQQDWEYNKRQRPSWTPPGFVFAIMWPLFVFGIRAVTAAMVVQASGGIYATPAIAALMTHLGIANLWNTANNVEKRLGPSVIILYGLVASKALASFAFYQVSPLAGKLLALTLTWLTAAAALETDMWRINPDPDTGKKEPLYPAKADKWTTRFRWESS